jgi:hypothetical protein
MKTAGCSHIQFKQGGKHGKLTAVTPDGYRVREIIPSTPSDWRAGANAVAGLKRRLRALNCVV